MMSFLDFPVEKSTIWTELYCITFYLLILFGNWKSAITRPFSKNVRNQYKKFVIFSVGFAIVTFCTLGDFYHMMMHLHSKGFTEDSTNFGVEYVYGVIGALVGKNYFLFRLIIFGGAYAVYCKTAKRFSIDPYYAAIYIYIAHVILFSYARATLAMALYYWGLSFICEPSKKMKWLGYVFGLILIVFCRVFHTSSIVMIVSTLAILIPLRKWSIIILLVSIPSVAIIFKDYFESFVESGVADDYLANKFDRYVDRESSVGIARIIIDTFSYASFYIPLFFSTTAIFFKNKYSKIPNSILRLYKVTFMLMFVSATFLFFGETFYTFYYRVLYMSMIPLTILILRLYKENYMSRQALFLCVAPGVPYMIIRTLYCIYLGNLGIQ